MSVIVARKRGSDMSVLGCELQAPAIRQLPDMRAVDFLPGCLMLKDRGFPRTAAALPFSFIDQRLQSTAVQVKPDPVPGLEKGKTASDD